MALIVKGSGIVLFFKDGSSKRFPGMGFIHDPDGEYFDKCEVFIGKVVKTQRKPAKTSDKANRYFGSRYTQREATVDIPAGPWVPQGEVVEIRYVRKGQYAAKYFHVFKQRSPMLSKCRSYYCLALQGGCIVDDRGFVFP
jgi:hypothetical protein